MGNIWIYGCSHATRDFNLNDKDLSWLEIVSYKTGLQIKNRAESGTSNDNIIDNIIKDINLIDNRDFVIVLMTYPYRVKISKNKVLRPSEADDQWWYKAVNEDDYYSTRFLQQFFSLKLLLDDKNYLLTFVDPTLILNLASYNNIIRQYLKTNVFYFPNMILTKSFEIGADNNHLSPIGHMDMGEFIIKKLTQLTNKSN